MSILCDYDLHEKLENLVYPADHDLVNPASIDIRVGKNAMVQYGTEWHATNIEHGGLDVPPYELVLVETFEIVSIPTNLAVDLRLKSSMARLGWNHSLAFWIDPGWNGILTMEIINQSKGQLHLSYGQRFAQMIVHSLTGQVIKPYDGRYQNATSVEADK